MKIKSIHITEFGGLKDYKLDFSDSLNIIMGENESGKSTILLFITYMLYGLAKKGANASVDKARSISWDNAKAEGRMDVEKDGVAYRIVRSLKGKTANSTARIYELESGEMLECTEPSEFFLEGVSRETFESCCLCGQLRASGMHGTQVVETLSNLSLGADESVNAADVIDRIRAARKEYKHERGKGGLIDDVALEIERLSEKKIITENRLARLESDRIALRVKSEEYEVAKKRLDEAERKRALRETLLSLKKLNEHKKLCAELEAAEDGLARLKAESGFSDTEPTAATVEELRALAFEYDKKKNAFDIVLSTPATEPSRIDLAALRRAEQIRSEGGKDACVEKIRATEKKRSALKTAAIMSSVIGALGFALCVFSLAFIAVGAVFLILGALCLALRPRACDTEAQIENAFAQLELYEAESARAEREKAARESASDALDFAEGEIKKKLAFFGREEAKEPREALDKLAFDISRYLEGLASATQKASVCRTLVSRSAETLEGLDEAELLARIPEGTDLADSLDNAENEYRIAFAEEKRLSSEVTDLRIRTESAGVGEDTLCELKERISELEEKKGEYQERYDIYSLAIEALEGARDNLQKSFAPTVRKRAGELVSRISSGKYSNLFISNDLEVKIDDGATPRAVTSLSSGTSDILYIALRISLIESIFKCETPFFLDETLSQVDDRRAAEVLALLAEHTSSGNQCLFFTCHKREAALCGENGIAFNLIKLN